MDDRAEFIYCRVECFGAKPILERYAGGEQSLKVADANVDGVVWQIRTWWEAGGRRLTQPISAI